MHLLWFKHATEECIGHWAASGKRFLVSQTYHNGYHFYPSHQKLIVLTAYPAMTHADEHWRRVQDDPYAAIINLDNGSHRQGILKRLQSSEHQLFIAEMNDPVGLQLLCYNFQQQLLEWFTGQIGEAVGEQKWWPPDLIVKYGRVYIRMTWKKREYLLGYEQLQEWYEQKSAAIGKRD